MEVVIKKKALALLACLLLILFSVFGYTKYYEIKYKYTSDVWYNPTYGTLFRESDNQMFFVKRTGDYLFHGTFAGDDPHNMVITVSWFIDQCKEGYQVDSGDMYKDGTSIKVSCFYSERTGQFYIEYNAIVTFEDEYVVNNIHKEFRGELRGYEFSVDWFKLKEYSQLQQKYDTARELN